MVRDIEVHHLSEQYGRILMRTQYSPQRRRDFPGRQRAGRCLIEQRLKEVKIAAVDQRNLHRCMAQRFSRIQTAESSADDDDSMRAHTFWMLPILSGCNRCLHSEAA